MTTATERIPVLMTKAQKAALARKAKAAHLTMGEFLRRAGDAYDPQEDPALLAGLIDQVLKSTAEATRAIDEALRCVAESEARLTKMQAGVPVRKAA